MLKQMLRAAILCGAFLAAVSGVFADEGGPGGEPYVKNALDKLKCGKYPKGIGWFPGKPGDNANNFNGKLGKNLILRLRGKTKHLSGEIDLSAFRGREILMTLVMRGEKSSYTPESGRFGCFFIHYATPSGNTYIGRGFDGVPGGTFDWMELPFQFVTNPEDDLSHFTVYLSGNYDQGDLFLKEIRFEVAKNPLYKPPVPLPEGFRCEYSDAVRNHPRMTGIVAGNYAGRTRFSMETDGKKLVSWGVNFMRWWVGPNWSRADLDDPAGFEKVLSEELAHTDAFLPEFQKAGMKILLTPAVPGGRFKRPGSMGYYLFISENLMERYKEMWRFVAKRYKDNPTVWGYDLMNEPFQNKLEQCDKFDYLWTQYQAALAIREIDPEKPIVVSANAGGSPGNYLAGVTMWPFPLKNILYQMHFYEPIAYTHNGISGTGTIAPGQNGTYPGLVVRNQKYDFDGLREVMKPVRDFQKKYGALIYMGEFSVRRDAPGGAQWLDDVATLADEYGWIWTYHSYGEFHGWNLEYESFTPFDQQRIATEPTDRLKSVLKHWKRNKKLH